MWTVRVLQLLALAVLAPRIARGRRRVAPLTARPAPAGVVSVVIPARNEEARLGPCLDGLAADGDLLEVIVADDGSTDRTAQIAREHGARVVSCPSPPDGWTGKPWALQQGLEAARGDVVVFLDADTRPAPGLIGALAELAGERTLLSVAPRFTTAGGLDTALHASFASTLVYRFGATDVEPWEPPPWRALLNGQCICLRRADLIAAGGWARVRGNMTEDVALARTLRRDGWRLAFRDATALLDVAGYTSARATWEGWGRSLMAADVARPAEQAADLAVLWLCWALPLPRLVARRGRPVDVALVALRLALAGALRKNYPGRALASSFAPLADLAVAVRLTWSVLRPTRSWRGRTYAR